ncbi:MAG: hypothetical protein Q8O19_03040, partial [Rectinemataceae bacterium]|nr:hypothetical protein [Rectinemataceae bacterium]
LIGDPMGLTPISTTLAGSTSPFPAGNPATPLNAFLHWPSVASTTAPFHQEPMVSDLETEFTGRSHLMPSTDSSPSAAPVLVLLRYRRQILPDGSIPAIAEVPAHLDVKGLKASGAYSLHTEYSSKSRAFDSPLLDGLETIKASHRRGVPELWINQAWALEFAEFIFRLVGNSEPPSIIEIHPPFVSSMPTMDAFLDVYEVFESAILARFPGCKIVIENRSGTKHPHAFLVSDADSIVALGNALSNRPLRLGIAFDMPQMFTRECGSKHSVGMEDVSLLERMMAIHEQIHTLHLWGRGGSGGAHSGALDGLFAPGTGAKEACLALLNRMLNDGHPRHLVLEVSKGEDLASILEDLTQAGFVCEVSCQAVG